jgi:predicted amidophosphoribosyltransferase
MSQYRRPRAERPETLVGDDRVCRDCGRLVSTADQFCSGCGVSFVATVERHEQRLGLPGFNYHFVQGFGWGWGLPRLLQRLL